MKNEKNIQLTFHCFFSLKISKFLKKKGFSDGYIYQLIKNQNITVNNKIVHGKNEILPFFSCVNLRLNDEDSFIVPKDKPLNIVYEDDFILIVNKEKDLDIEPTKANYTNTLANRLQHYYNENHIMSKIHFVNRLDKITSGLVLIAKNGYIHSLFLKTKIIKKYEALVSGKVNKKGFIKVRMKKAENSIKRIVSNDGKVAISKYKRLYYDGSNSMVSVRLFTGRTHQIRLSFAYINHPLVGDILYNENIKSGTFYLNAYYLKFTHPITNKKITISLKDT